MRQFFAAPADDGDDFWIAQSANLQTPPACVLDRSSGVTSEAAGAIEQQIVIVHQKPPARSGLFRTANNGAPCPRCPSLASG